jgi:hypothetical protein
MDNELYFNDKPVNGQILDFKRVEVIYIPNFKLVSFANKSMHWTEKKKIKDKQHWIIVSYVRPFINCMRFPIKIILTRIAPRKYDADDNLRMSFKYIKDKIAHLFFPTTEIGRADDFSCFTWEYLQERRQPKEYGIRIELIEI